MARLTLQPSKKKSAAHRVAQSEGESAVRLLQENGYPSKRRANGQSEHSCPAHEEPGTPKRGQTKFYVDIESSQFQCHSASCGFSGNLVTLERHFGVDPEYSASEYQTREQKLRKYEQALQDDPDLRAVFHEDGLNDETLKRFRIGWDEEKERYVIPYLDGKTPVVFRFYNPDPSEYYDKEGNLRKQLKYYWETGATAILYNFNDASGDDKGRVILCEGEKKAMALAQIGYNAVATPGAGMFKDEWHQYFTDAREIVICFDNDNPEHPDNQREISKCKPCLKAGREECRGHNPGQDAAHKVENILGWRSRNVVLPLPDRQTKKTDINEYFVRDGHTAAEFAEFVFNEKAEPYRVQTLDQIMEDPPDEVAMLVEHGILPKGGRLLVAGRPKAGKSIFVENLALSIASGIPFLGKFDISDPSRVLLLDRELSRSSLYQRLTELIKNRPGYRVGAENLAIDHDHLIKIDRKGAYDVLERLVTYNGADVVIFDTAYKFFACVDTETEALTQRGWVRGEDLSTDDMILSMDPEDGRLKWSPVNRVHRNHYSGEMFHMTSTAMDAMVTPNHKWLTQRGLVEAQDLKQRDVIKTMGAPEESTANVYSDAFVEVVGWSVTEGNYWESDVEGSTACTVTITQNPGPLADRIELALKRSGAEWTETRSGQNYKQRAFRVRGEVAREIIRVAPERVLSSEFMLALSQDQRVLLIDTMVDGDGHRSDSNDYYSQKCPKHTDAFIMLCALAGIATTQIVREETTSFGESKTYTIKMNRLTLRNGTTTHVRSLDWHGAHMRQRGSHGSNVANVEYDDMVWCPETDYGTFVARRNGRVFVTGNSSMDSASSMTAAFEVLDKLIHETGVSVVMTHHQKKKQGGRDKTASGGDMADPEDVAGSFLWTGWPNASILLNFMGNSVENPFNSVATFTAFRDAAPPEPLALYRDRDSISYSAIRPVSPETAVRTMQEKTKPSTETVMQWLFEQTPIPRAEAEQGLSDHFFVSPGVVRPYLIDALATEYFVTKGKSEIIHYHEDEPESWDDERQLRLVKGEAGNDLNKF